MVGAVEGGGTAIPPSLTEDGFLDGRVKALQPEKGYRAGIDAVFLAAGVPCAAGETVFEAGMGAGIAALCLAFRVPGVKITGIEVSSRYALLAEENARRNELAEAIRVIQGDVREATRAGLAQYPPAGSFHHVYANPPYYEADKVQPSPVALKADAHSMGPEDLEAWIKVLVAMAVPRGSITLIHRPELLCRILAALEGRAGDVRIMPLHARDDEPASRIIIQAVKASRAPLKVLRGFVLHGPGNGFTPEAEAVLRAGAPLALA